MGSDTKRIERPPYPAAPDGRGRVLALVAALVLTAMWAYSRPEDADARRSAAPTVETQVAPVVAGLDTLYLDFDEVALATLEARRKQALERGLLAQRADDHVSVIVRFRDKKLRGKARLKGDLTDHLLTNRWSLRFKLARDARLLGMRKFSLQHPMTRNYYNEQIFYEQLRERGVLTPRYAFVNVVRNGKALGVMALEEHFSKELLESQARREGVILRFDESAYWQALGADDFMSDHLTATPFRPNYTARSAHLARDLESARGLLRGFLNGELSASQAFDAETMSSFLAVSELWDSWHALRWHNLRFYYNPVLARLEPIAYDAMLGDHHRDRVPEVLNASSSAEHFNMTVTARMLEDGALRGATLAKLRKLASDYVAGPGREAVARSEQQHRQQLRGAGLPDERLVSEAQLARARELLALDESNFRTLERAAKMPEFEADTGGAVGRMPAQLDAYLVREDGGRYLEVYNRTRDPLRVTAVTGATLVDGPALPITLPAPARRAPYVRTRWRLSRAAMPDSASDGVRDGERNGEHRVGEPAAEAPVRVHAEAASGEPATVARAIEYSAVRSRGLLDAPTLDAFLERHPGFRADEDGLHLARGMHLFREPLVLPAGVALFVHAGATLRFSEQAYLLLRGPLQMRGSPDAPVTLEPVPGATWPGLAVLRAGARSRLEHVVIRGTRGVETADWGLTGGAVFYESDLDVRRLSLEQSGAEDALNVVRGRLEASGLRVVKTASDAVDLDYATGHIDGARFEDIGADAIDTSGTEVTISNARFTRIGDKAVSAGEHSRVRVSEIEVTGASVGIASKDSSRVRVSQATFHDISFAALAAFQKKPEFDGGIIEATAITVDPKHDRARAQPGSRITIDGEQVPARAIEFSRLYPETRGTATNSTAP